VFRQSSRHFVVHGIAATQSPLPCSGLQCQHLC
jgi:hypothetical protein